MSQLLRVTTRRNNIGRLAAVAGLLAVIVAVIVLWPRMHLPAQDTWAAVWFIGALCLWFIYGAANMVGSANQERIALKFLRAPRVEGTTHWIGGTRWIIVNDEFHRLHGDAGDRGASYELGTSHAVRRGNEIEEYRKRRRWILVSLGCMAVCSILVIAVSPIFFIGVFAPSLLVVFLITVEYIYRLGFQRMPGAMVLDAPPFSFDRDVVAEQKVHGDAGLATEEEAREAAAGAGGRLSIHDWDF